MFPQLAWRVLRTTDKRCLWKFCWNFGVKAGWSVERFKQRLRRGEYFPPYWHLSIINSCNLRCEGCWADVEAPREMIELDQLNRLVNEARQHGNRFFGLLGGEPLLHPQLFEFLAAHPDCYFQLFTNGLLITEKVAEDLRRLGQVSPLVSIEGKETVSDERRGGREVYRRTMRGLENCLRAGLLTGVATSICRNNIEELLTEDWLRELIRRGVHYVWYYTYRPVGPRMGAGLALTTEQVLRVRQFAVEMRAQLPIAIVDAYYDHEGCSLCPSATGISHHISARGEIEPCPVIQFATDNIGDPRGLYATVRDSAFLRDYRLAARQAGRGCIVLERPDLLRELIQKHGARDTTARGTALAELERMSPRPSQWLPGYEIPESHWLYRLGKRLWFNDFGAYRAVRHEVAAKRQALKRNLDLAKASVDTTGDGRRQQDDPGAPAS